jgi:hypothetical protein
MPKTLLLLITSSFLAAAAAHAKIDLRPKGQKIEDPGSATPLLYKAPQNGENATPSKLKVSATCTDSMGMVVKSTDKGYESCLRSNMNRTKVQNPSEKNPNSIGFTIGN